MYNLVNKPGLPKAQRQGHKNGQELLLPMPYIVMIGVKLSKLHPLSHQISVVRLCFT